MNKTVLKTKIQFRNLKKVLKQIKKINRPCYGATLNGKDMYILKKPEYCALVFGNESHGINKSIISLLDKELLIPAKNNMIDSLNVAVAFGIILSEFR